MSKKYAPARFFIRSGAFVRSQLACKCALKRAFFVLNFAWADQARRPLKTRVSPAFGAHSSYAIQPFPYSQLA
jgi:hypothetical protein